MLPNAQIRVARGTATRYVTHVEGGDDARPANWSPWIAPSQWRYRPRRSRHAPVKAQEGWSMAGRLRRTVVAVTLVVLLLPMAAATSLADTGPAPTEVFKFSNSGFTAFADAGTCSDPVDDIVTCSSRNISLVSGKSREQGSGAIHATEVCYGTFTDVFNQETGETLSFTGESGCTMDLGEGSVIERDLSSATIAPATITLEAIVCDPNAPRPGRRARSRSKARSRRPRLRPARPSAASSTTASAPSAKGPGARNGMRCSRAPPMANRWR